MPLKDLYTIPLVPGSAKDRTGAEALRRHAERPNMASRQTRRGQPCEHSHTCQAIPIQVPPRLNLQVVKNHPSNDTQRLGEEFRRAGLGVADGYIEIEGSPDLIVEIVSESSMTKDTRRLPERYFLAGVLEYWFVDARGKDLVFHIHRRRGRFVRVKPDAHGFQKSTVLGRRFRFTRRRDDLGMWFYDLNVRN